MKSKKLVCGAMAAAITLSVAFSGCSLISTLNDEDMRQTIATVDISGSENIAKEGLSDYVSAIAPANIIKRDLIAAFVNVGSSYIQSGYSYADVFNMLVDSLTSNEIVTQYATLSLLKEKSAQDADILATFNSLGSQVEKYEFLLDGETSEVEGVESDRVLLAKYDLYSSINDSIDALEQSIIDEDEEEAGTDTRTTPSNADTERENYLPLENGELDYGIYTGYEGYLIGDSGAYQDDELEGSTRETRKRAYAAFIANLKTNYLISDEDNTLEVLSISYIQDEYVTRLQQQVIDEYLERYSQSQEALIDEVDANNEYVFLRERYETDLAAQEISNDTSSFDTTMGNLSDTSFILYAPATEGTDGGTYGYVYNILLPFSAAQSLYIDSEDTSAEYYFMRKDLLDDIKTYDQRSAWFNGATDYSFDASATTLDYYGKDAGRNYLSFENNLLKADRYEELDKYVGLYSYNGSVRENADGTYSLIANELTIDGMLDEFTAYINFVLDDNNAASYSLNSDYNVTSPDDYYTEETRDNPDKSERKIDYSRFIYAKGKVELSDKTLGSLFVKDSDQYKALSAVNELQYAYTTDTSVLSEYIGYSVSAYDTSYIPEFEYAAQEAVKEGAGTFYVCAGDYGWHLIYVTATFDVNGGAVMGEEVDWTAASVTKEGTFQNLYYNWIKDTTLSNITTNRRTLIIDAFGGDTVTLFEDAYRDLLELDA